MSFHRWGFSYADEGDGILPHNGGNPPPPAWCDYSYWELSRTTWFYKCPYNENGATAGTVLHCPEAESSVPRYGYAPKNYTDYSLNRYMGGQKNNFGIGDFGTPRTQRLSSRTYWFADAKFHAGGSGYSVSGWMDPANSGTYWVPWPWDHLEWSAHPNRAANFVFGDGHAKAMTKIAYDAMSTAEKEVFRGVP